MPFLSLAGWAALKTIGWSGVGRWAAQRGAGLLTGSGAWAVVVVGLVLGGLVLWHWIDPPERTYTAAEINADRLARENEMLRRAAKEKAEAVANRERELAMAWDVNRGLVDENEKLRGARAAPVAGGGIADSDPWLRAKRTRAGQAGAGADRR
jgi:hypothetical protein